MVRNSKALKSFLDIEKNCCQSKLQTDKSDKSLLSQIINTSKIERDHNCSIISNIYNNTEDNSIVNKSVYAQQVQQSPLCSYRDIESGIGGNLGKCNSRSRSMISVDCLMNTTNQQVNGIKTSRLNESNINNSNIANMSNIINTNAS